MKRPILLLLALFMVTMMSAQRITRDFKGVSMSKALKEIGKGTPLIYVDNRLIRCYGLMNL